MEGMECNSLGIRGPPFRRCPPPFLGIDTLTGMRSCLIYKACLCRLKMSMLAKCQHNAGSVHLKPISASH